MRASARPTVAGVVRAGESIVAIAVRRAVEAGLANLVTRIRTRCGQEIRETAVRIRIVMIRIANVDPVAESSVGTGSE